MKTFQAIVIALTLAVVIAGNCQNGDVFGSYGGDVLQFPKKGTSNIANYNSHRPCPDATVDLTEKWTIGFDYEYVKSHATQFSSIFSFTTEKGSKVRLQSENTCSECQQPKLWLYKKQFYFGNTKANKLIVSPITQTKGRVVLVSDGQLQTMYINGVAYGSMSSLIMAGQKQLFISRGKSGSGDFIKVGKFTLQVGVAQHPVQPGCAKSMFGGFSSNTWRSPVKGFIPCPSAVVKRTSARYTLSFEYKPVETTNYDASVLRMISRGITPQGTRKSYLQLKVLKKSHRLVFDPAAVNGYKMTTGKNWFKVGKAYKVTFLLMSDRAVIMVDGKIKDTKWLNQVKSGEDLILLVGSMGQNPSKNLFRNFKLTYGQVEMPGRSHCDENPAGMFSQNKWLQPKFALIPCQGKYFALDNRYTIKFDLKVLTKFQYDTELFRIEETYQNQRGKPYVGILRNQSKLNLKFETDKGVKTVNPSFEFQLGQSYKISIQVDVDTVVVRQGMFEIANQKIGRVKTSNAAEAHFTGRWTSNNPNSRIKNWSLSRGGRVCVRVFSECNFQGAHADICEDSPNLKDQGWDYTIKSVKIPKDYDQTVTLYTENDYKLKKVVLTKSKNCLTTKDFSFIQVKSGSRPINFNSIKLTKKEE